MSLSLDSKLVAIRDAKLADLGPRPPWYRPFARRRWRIHRAAILAMGVTHADAIMREYYTPASMQDIAERRAPFLALLRKGEP